MFEEYYLWHKSRRGCTSTTFLRMRRNFDTHGGGVPPHGPHPDTVGTLVGRTGDSVTMDCNPYEI
ncbi:hypothetical protein HLH33_19735 [Gluconacetobacter diazotrophicus]|uniref:Uncharacterized protein n=1 Tax=Gluconacetobacter diazotrophicus TaxID=33996 RepID=A0A7W4I8Z8_GLUDI|nr:hypothetical protein [Gluconacetobacter diazotrophicus]MBB2158485.1 hypothetical protein [Gluconacetobacter diazotrophicus]